MRVIVFMGQAVNLNGETLGVKGVGKDSCADALESIHPNMRFERIAFADRLKDAVSLEYGLPRKVYDTPEMKEVAIDHLNGWSYRMLLEQIGTDLFRKSLKDEHVWVDWYMKLTAELAAQKPFDKLEQHVYERHTDQFKSAAVSVGLPTDDRPVIVLTTDCRFPDEYKALKANKDLDVTFVMVQRTFDREAPSSLHPSNQHHPEMVPDLVIENNGPIGDLFDIMLKQIKL